MDGSTRLETLRIARELVIDEYIQMKSQLHQRWQAESEQIWRDRRESLPYPDFPPYPSEEEIMDRARKLQAFLEETKSPLVRQAIVDHESGNTAPTGPTIAWGPTGNAAPANTSPVFSTVGRFDMTPLTEAERLLPELIKKLEEIRTGPTNL